MRSKGVGGLSHLWMVMLCIASFAFGMLFTNKTWIGRMDTSRTQNSMDATRFQNHKTIKESCEDGKAKPKLTDNVFEEVSKTHDAIETLDKAVSMLEMELAAARAHATPTLIWKRANSTFANIEAAKAFIVVGINTGFSSRKRRDAIRATWMPHGGDLRRLEETKGIVVRFIIGHSATPGSILDRGIQVENAKYGDFLILEHTEGYYVLTTKIKTFFSTAVAKWDADFYVKVDDDVHVNLGMLGLTLAKHKSKPRVYMGCMKSGQVLAQKGVRYHEPEYWRFGEEGNKYFRHASGQIYAISKDLATYISINGPILHNYANEDVSLGSWLIGLDVEQIDDRSLCCSTPPDCESKAQTGNGCVASFDWACSGICKAVVRMKDVHQRCGEGDAVWQAAF